MRRGRRFPDVTAEEANDSFDIGGEERYGLLRLAALYRVEALDGLRKIRMGRKTVHGVRGDYGNAALHQDGGRFRKRGI